MWITVVKACPGILCIVCICWPLPCKDHMNVFGRARYGIVVNIKTYVCITDINIDIGISSNLTSTCLHRSCMYHKSTTWSMQAFLSVNCVKWINRIASSCLDFIFWGLFSLTWTDLIPTPISYHIPSVESEEMASVKLVTGSSFPVRHSNFE